MYSAINHKVYALPFEVNFQLSHSPIMDGIISLHHDIMIYIFLVIIGITYALFRTSVYSTKKNNLTESNTFNSATHILFPTYKHYLDNEAYIEFIWAIFPTFILTMICLVTISFLYSAASYIYLPTHTIYVTGHQWYWTYEYSELGIQFDSYMIIEDYLREGELRLLEVDNRLLLPAQSHVRTFITSDDVIHSWAIPSLGIKLDASPGRINHCHIFSKSIGIFYGQCSELCGIGHNYMPVVVQTIPIYLFNYIINFLVN